MLHLSPTEEKAKTGKRVMSHPNVITIHQTFVDDFPMLYDAMESYKIMLPKKYFNEGLGRNKTLFIIMPKCQTTLREYLSENRAVTFDQRFHLLLQLLNAVAYLEKNNVSHRDLKCDNILLNSCDNYQLDYPRLILTDFGDCFCGINKMMLKYDSYDVSLGGNCALMAPEIINARPGKNSYVDYSKNDAWAVGAISYEIFGKNNPFYNTLRNDFYDEDALPLLSSRSQMVDIVVQHLLKKDPEKRISAGLAAAVLYIWRYGPLHWKIPNYLVTQSEIESWLLKLCIESRRECVKKLSISECQPNIQHSLVFLWMTSIDTIIASILFIQGIGATVYVVD